MAKKKTTTDQLAKWCAENPTLRIQRGSGMLIPAAVLAIAIPEAVKMMNADEGTTAPEAAESSSEGGDA
tara:strand:- start:435 stop:641 length:207 start_codon:yes stop_codon:yes gene_type:complete